MFFECLLLNYQMYDWAYFKNKYSDYMKENIYEFDRDLDLDFDLNLDSDSDIDMDIGTSMDMDMDKNRNKICKKRKFGDAFDPLTFEFMRFGEIVGDNYVFKLKEYDLIIPVHEDGDKGPSIGEENEGIKIEISEEDDNEKMDEFNSDYFKREFEQKLDTLNKLIEIEFNFDEYRKRPETLD